MKKLITIIIVASLALTIQAQDVTNTLGTDGNFYVNKLGGTPSYLTLSSTGDHIMQFSSVTNGFTIKGEGGDAVFSLSEYHNIAGATMLTIGHADANWLGGNFSHLQLQSETQAVGNKFSMVARGAINYINAYSASGTGTSPLTSIDNHSLFHINAYGYSSSGNRLAAGISFVVDGTPAGNFVPGRIEFHTGTNATISTPRMIIKSNGTVNIANLSGSGAGYVAVDNDGNLSYITGSGGATSIDGLSDGRTGNTSVYLGDNAGGSSTGSQNTVIGHHAGLILANDGEHNILIGKEAGSNITTGDDNIAITVGSANISTGSGNIVIGKWPTIVHNGATDNQLNIGHTIYATGLYAAGAKVGIGWGHHNPTATLDVDGDVKIKDVLHLTPSSTPTSPSKGDIYFDSGTNTARCWDGATWHDLW